MKSLLWLRPTNYTLASGSEYYVSSVSSVLARYEFRSSVLGLYDGYWLGVASPHTDEAIKRITDFLRFLINPRALKPVRDRYLYRRMARNLQVFLDAEQFEGIGFAFPYPGIVETLEFLECPKIIWSLDDPLIFNENWFSVARECDHIFTVSRGSLERYRDEGIDWVTWLPPGADTETFRPAVEQVQYRIVFLGSNHEDRRPGLNRILRPLIEEFGRDVHLFGSGWRPNGATLHGPVPWSRIPGVLSRSLIAINLYREPARICDLSPNLRLFETLACRTFLISDEMEGIEDLFQPGHHLVVAQEDNVVQIVKDAWKNPEWRTDVAERGYREVLLRHTLEHRVPTLLKVVRQL